MKILTMDGALFFILAVLFADISGNTEFVRVEDFFTKFDSKNDYDCGIQNRIMGGTETVPGELPWVAALEYEFTENHENAGINCGGSVVSYKYILTAAHCIHPTRMEIIKVWVGVLRLSEAETGEANRVQKLDPEEQIPHENFNSPKGANDIGLIRVKQDIIFTDYIRAICMPKENLQPPSLGTMLTVAGWGHIGNGGDKSDIKLKVDLALIENRICAEGLKLPVGDTHLCTGEEAGKDSCQGDSGGPLMKNFTDTASGKIYWYQAGIVSYGRGCGGTRIPLGVYTRVSKFIDWMRKNAH